MPDFSRMLPRLYRLLRVDRWARTRAGERLFLAAFFAYKRWIEDPHAAFAKRHPEVFAGGHVLDVGANVGYTASVFARAISPGFRVYALEPDAVNFARLQRVTRRLTNVVAMCTAAGDHDGRALLLHNPEHPGDHRLVDASGENVTAVDIIRLDSLDAAPVKFVKIDVQGHELAVCRGMSRLLEDNAALEVTFEYSGPGSDPVVAFFRDRGFHIHLLRHNGSITPLSGTVSPEMLKARGYCDLFATRRKMG